MKKLSPARIAVLGIFCLAASSYANAYTASFSFFRPLRMGMSGEDVRQLQKVLNSDPVTQVSQAGPGSPGQETSYFGSLTYSAVVRFQEKYRNEILVPNNLSSGTGFVGVSTMSVLNSGSEVSANSSIPPASVVSTVPPAVSPAPVAQNISPTNPNLKNIDRFLSAIDTLSVKKGIPSQTVAIIKNQIYKDAATSTDLQAAFLDLVRNNQPSSIWKESPYAGFISGIVSSLKKALVPSPVYAAGGVPFGGALLYSFFCTCSSNWLLTLEPLPPTFVTLLSYQPGSQAYLSNNIPATSWLLGEYSAGGQCLVYIGTGCAGLPTEGLITPTVGSSPL